MGKDATLTTFI